jgi:phospholipase/carboxylesterase
MRHSAPFPLLEAGRPQGAARFAGVLLHGRGGTPAAMIELASRLDLDGIRWLAPGADGGSWYPNRFMEPVASNEPFLTRAIERCDAAVGDAAEGGRLIASQLVVIGFSQGACLALEYALRHPGRCGAAIVFTGGLIGLPGTDWQPSARTLAGLRVLVTGSDVDEWVPEARVRETARVLTAKGADVRLRVYAGRPHVISDEEIVEARTFLASQLERSAASIGSVP